MVVVGVAASLAELLEIVRRTMPDVIVVGLADHRLPVECLALLLEHPEMKLLGLRPRDGRAYLFAVRLEQVDIGAVGPGALVDAVREAVHGS
jgi:hypothetical protein